MGGDTCSHHSALLHFWEGREELPFWREDGEGGPFWSMGITTCHILPTKYPFSLGTGRVLGLEACSIPTWEECIHSLEREEGGWEGGFTGLRFHWWVEGGWEDTTWKWRGGCTSGCTATLLPACFWKEWAYWAHHHSGRLGLWAYCTFWREEPPTILIHFSPGTGAGRTLWESWGFPAFSTWGLEGLPIFFFWEAGRFLGLPACTSVLHVPGACLLPGSWAWRGLGWEEGGWLGWEMPPAISCRV